jgi:molybdate transport system substrate-binding protein
MKFAQDRVLAMKLRTLLLILPLSLALHQAQAAEPATSDTLTVFSAGSLRGALGAVEQQYAALNGTKFNNVFGPAGLLLKRIDSGETPDMFLSANLAHPQRLVDEGKALPALVFVRNRLCVLGRPGLNLTSGNLLDTLLDPSINVGTSTPGADPGGDYAWQLFSRADKVRPGAYATLTQKAKQLVGGPNSPKVPPGQNALQYFFAQHDADLFIGYCSSQKRLPQDGAGKVELPSALKVTADYGLVVLKGSEHQKAAASMFALYLLTPEAQATFSAYGFEAIAKPENEKGL